MKEVWKDVKGFENVYMISSYGRLASIRNGNFHILSNVNSKGGYFSVILKTNNGKKRHTRIHRLVYESFIGELPNGEKMHVHHINGNKQDNRVENLQLISCTEHHAQHLKNNPHLIDGMVYYNKYVKTKIILQCDLKGNVINAFPNAKEASRVTGVCGRNILQVASKTPYNSKGNTRKQAGGYIWKFKED